MKRVTKIIWIIALIIIVFLSLGTCIQAFLYNPIPEYLGLPAVFDETRTQNALKDIYLYTIVEFSNYMLLILIGIVVLFKMRKSNQDLKYFNVSLIVLSVVNSIIEIIKYQEEYLRYATQIMNILPIMTVWVAITLIASIFFFIRCKKESKYNQEA